MRPLALAPIAALLAGCSLNYADTTFAATPRFQHSTEAEGERRNDRAGEPSRPAETAVPTQKGAEPSRETSAEAIGKTPVVFPADAPPSGVAPDHSDRPPVVLGSVQPPTAGQ